MCFGCSTKRDYDGEHFHYFGYLVFIQCIINALFAYAGNVCGVCVHVLIEVTSSYSLCKVWCTSRAGPNELDVSVFIHLRWCYVDQ